MQKNSDISEQPTSLNPPVKGIEILSKLSNLKTRREFVGLLGITGASLFLDHFARGISFNPSKTEAEALALDPIIDLTAPTFVEECADAHLRADATLGERINVTNCKLIGVFLGFPDQLQGIADLQTGIYHTTYLNDIKVVPEFYNHFTGITMTLDTIPYVIAEHPWDYYKTRYDGDNVYWMSDLIWDELHARGVFAEHYDGHTYPIYQMFDAPDPSTPPRIAGVGRAFRDGSKGWFGETIQSGWLLLSDYNKYGLKYNTIHETGHAISLPDRRNIPKTVMNPTIDNNNKPTISLDQIDISQLIVPLPYQSFLPLMFKN